MEDDGQGAYVFAPFGEASACWNPFDCIRTGPDAWEDSALLADMLVVPRKYADGFWDESARNLLRGVILHLVTSGGRNRRNLATVRNILAADPASFSKTLADMQNSDSDIVRRAANAYLNSDTKVQDGIRSSLDSHMGVWDSPRLAKIMGRSDFKFEDLKRGNLSLYFSIPPERLVLYAPVLRVFFGLAIAAMTREQTKTFAPVTFFLDEFPQLGHMKPIEDGIALLAGYGVRLWLFAQDLGQIKRIYGEGTQTILANCQCRSFFGTSDIDTAKLVSDMCGTMTVPVVGFGESRQTDFGATGASRNENVSFTGRPLMTPQEVMALPRTEQLVFFQGLNPVKGYLAPYFEHDYFDGIYDPIEKGMDWINRLFAPEDEDELAGQDISVDASGQDVDERPPSERRSQDKAISRPPSFDR
jgi:type IV secretion system protein VirD4